MISHCRPEAPVRCASGPYDRSARGVRSECTRCRAGHPVPVARVAAGVAEELSRLPDRGGKQLQGRRQDREDRQPRHGGADDGHRRPCQVRIQVPAGCLETTTTGAAPAATPRMSWVRSRIAVCQVVMDSSCRVVAPARRSRKSGPRRPTVAMTSLFTRATMIGLTPIGDLLPGPEDCDISGNGEQTGTGTLPAVVYPQMPVRVGQRHPPRRSASPIPPRCIRPPTGPSGLSPGFPGAG